MKKRIKLFLFILSIGISSCQQAEEYQVPQTEKKSKVIFKDSDDFWKTYNALAQMSYEEQMAWMSKNNAEKPLYNSIDSCKDEAMVQMPRAFQLLFNEDMEFQINDTTILFNKGKLNVTSIKGEKIEPPIPFGEAETHKIEPTATTRVKIDIPANDIGGSYQYEFNIPGNKYKFKYVHDFASTRIAFSDRAYCQLYLIVKLEYKGRKWNEAGEARNIKIYLQFLDNAFRDIDRTIKNATLNQQIVLGGHPLSIPMPKSPHQIDIDGQISQEVVGIPSTKKTNNIGNGPMPAPIRPEWQ